MEEKEPSKDGLRLSFKKRPIQDSKKLKLNIKPNNLKLKLVRKDQNSPMLSIQKFIYQQLKTQEPISDLKKLWNKYEKLNAHSLIIKKHEINYSVFREIVEQILETFEPYQISVKAVYYKHTEQITADDLIDHVV